MLWFTLFGFLQTTIAQEFTEYEKNEILRRHKQELMQESLRIYESQTKWNDHRSKFQKVLNYKGIYESNNITDVKLSTVNCSERLPGLIGFDYKHQNKRHHLLCFNSDSFLVRLFRVEHQELVLEQILFEISLKGKKIKHAIFFRRFNFNQLFVAILYNQGGTAGVTAYKLNDGGNVEEVFEKHRFETFEQVVKIEVVHHNIHEYNIVALVNNNNDNNNNNNKELSLKQEKEIIKVTLPNGNYLQTMRIQTQGFIVAANSSHWCVYSYQGNKTSQIILYHSNSPIVDVKTLSIVTQHYIIIAGQNVQLVYQWDGNAFKTAAKMLLRQVYKLNLLTVSYMREDYFFYFDQHDHSDQIRFFSYDLNRNMFLQFTSLSKSVLNFPKIIYETKYSNHFSEKDSAFDLKLSSSLIHVTAYKTAIISMLTKNVVSESSEIEQIRVEKKLGNIQQNLINLESIETISKHNVSVTFNFNVKFQLAVDTNMLVSRDLNLPQKWTINNQTFNQEKLFIPLQDLRNRISRINEWNQRVKYDIENEVIYKSSNVNITGYKEFVQIIYCPLIEATSIVVDYYRDKYISQVLSSLYRFSTNLPINGTKTLLGKTMVNSFLQLNRLNNIPPEHFLYGSLEQTIQSNLWYNEVETDRLFIGDQLAPNISFSKSIFINQDGNKQIDIYNRILFNDLNVHSLNLEKVDNLSLSNFANKVLRKYEQHEQIFKIPIQMDVLYVFKNLNTDMLNKWKTTELFANLVLKNQKTYFEKPVNFNGDVFFRFFNLEGKMNGIKVPDDLMNKYSDQVRFVLN